MKILAVANAAGSAGKSTTVVSLAALVGQSGRTVLVVDGDAQATATEWLGITDPSATLGDVLLRRSPLTDAILNTNTPNVQLVPAARDLDADLVELAAVVGREQRLKIALTQTDVDYDVVLIDCPGSISTLTVAALVASTAVLTVTQPTMKEMSGVAALDTVISDVREAYAPHLRLAGVVPCIVPGAGSGRLYSDAMALLTRTYPTLVTPPVRRSVRVPEAHAQSLPLPLHVPADPVTDDYRAVLGWLTERGVL